MQCKQKSERIYYVCSPSTKISYQRKHYNNLQEFDQLDSSARHQKLLRLKFQLKAMQQQYKNCLSQNNFIEKKIHERARSYMHINEKKKKQDIYRFCNKIKQESHHISNQNIERQQQKLKQIRLAKQAERKIIQLKKTSRIHINDQFTQRNKQTDLMIKQQIKTNNRKRMENFGKNYKSVKNSQSRLLNRKINIQNYIRKLAKNKKIQEYKKQIENYSRLNKNYELIEKNISGRREIISLFTTQDF